MQEGVILPFNMYSGFLDEVACHVDLSAKDGINSFTELTGLNVGGKPTIKSSMTNWRHFLSIVTLIIFRRNSSVSEQSWYDPPCDTEGVFPSTKRSCGIMVLTKPSTLISHIAPILETFNTLSSSILVKT